ncbi:hypothetical protein HOA92_04590 [archaeon]|jgi:hypothetical protein|nr:hypothetical protein [archaeon]MBT6762294.1 hypothetical protein [archaeon]
MYEHNNDNNNGKLLALIPVDQHKSSIDGHHAPLLVDQYKLSNSGNIAPLPVGDKYLSQPVPKEIGLPASLNSPIAQGFMRYLPTEKNPQRFLDQDERGDAWPMRNTPGSGNEFGLYTGGSIPVKLGDGDFNARNLLSTGNRFPKIIEKIDLGPHTVVKIDPDPVGLIIKDNVSAKYDHIGLLLSPKQGLDRLLGDLPHNSQNDPRLIDLIVDGTDNDNKEK